MQIINSKIFRSGVGIAMAASGVVMSISVALWQMHVPSYHKVFIVGIFIIGLLSIIYSIHFAITNRDSFSKRDKAYLIVAYLMIAWFMITIVMNLTESKYMYVGGGGLIIYCILYIIESVLRVRYRIGIAAALTKNAAANTNEHQHPNKSALSIADMSHREIEILDIMSLHNVSSTKDILPYLPKDTNEAQVDSVLTDLMQRANVYTRQELAERYKMSN
ncbi:MAG: hypothetical protein J6Y01_09145 [Spirochaetales bacterium]|nr:hypothetical protein [Spirochaetales bacterium]